MDKTQWIPTKDINLEKTIEKMFEEKNIQKNESEEEYEKVTPFDEEIHIEMCEQIKTNKTYPEKTVMSEEIKINDVFKCKYEEKRFLHYFNRPDMISRLYLDAHFRMLNTKGEYDKEKGQLIVKGGYVLDNGDGKTKISLGSYILELDVNPKEMSGLLLEEISKSKTTQFVIPIKMKEEYAEAQKGELIISLNTTQNETNYTRDAFSGKFKAIHVINRHTGNQLAKITRIEK